MAVMSEIKFFWVYSNFLKTRLRVFRKSEDPTLDQSKILDADVIGHSGMLCNKKCRMRSPGMKKYGFKNGLGIDGREKVEVDFRLSLSMY